MALAWARHGYVGGRRQVGGMLKLIPTHNQSRKSISQVLLKNAPRSLIVMARSSTLKSLRIRDRISVNTIGPSIHCVPSPASKCKIRMYQGIINLKPHRMSVTPKTVRKRRLKCYRESRMIVSFRYSTCFTVQALASVVSTVHAFASIEASAHRLAKKSHSGSRAG